MDWEGACHASGSNPPAKTRLAIRVMLQQTLVEIPGDAEEEFSTTGSELVPDSALLGFSATPVMILCKV